jgi:hypothetical protein
MTDGPPSASSNTNKWLRSGTILSALFPHGLPVSMRKRAARLAAEGALSAGASLLLAGAAGAGQGEIVAVFFTSAGLVHRFEKGAYPPAARPHAASTRAA